MPFTFFIQIGLIFIVILTIALRIILATREQVVQLKLSWSGVKVDGRITDYRMESAGRGGKRYYLIYD